MGKSPLSCEKKVCFQRPPSGKDPYPHFGPYHLSDLRPAGTLRASCGQKLDLTASGWIQNNRGTSHRSVRLEMRMGECLNDPQEKTSNCWCPLFGNFWVHSISHSLPITPASRLLLALGSQPLPRLDSKGILWEEAVGRGAGAACGPFPSRGCLFVFWGPDRETSFWLGKPRGKKNVFVFGVEWL